jgi:hypothetical protein
MFNFGISSGWRAVLLCTEIQNTSPTRWIRGMERLHSPPGSPGTHTETDCAGCTVNKLEKRFCCEVASYMDVVRWKIGGQGNVASEKMLESFVRY